ncbi:hypothetical protein KV100_17380 [Mumia sp. zg.B21]|uniref:hypothetical protein n=1 Tax=Mumia sp. zg.B21 TaxID=2855447 RepID=UPI001C6EF2F2|nr:hypothetical protein [Mumia sp. zg.B21]MBW9211426.1 hypothetical protein [Mumia sp. zg.B21]
MPAVDVIDQTYAPVPQRQLREVLCAESGWSEVLPGLELRCFEDRGDRGKRWSVSGTLDGTAEVWLEQAPEGTIVHLFLQADPSAPGMSTQGVRRMERDVRERLKRWVTQVRDTLDVGRPVGEPPATAQRGAAPTEDVRDAR